MSEKSIVGGSHRLSARNLFVYLQANQVSCGLEELGGCVCPFLPKGIKDLHMLTCMHVYGTTDTCDIILHATNMYYISITDIMVTTALYHHTLYMNTSTGMIGGNLFEPSSCSFVIKIQPIEISCCLFLCDKHC